MGYVQNLATGDEYYADSNSYKNGKKIRVSDVDRLEECNVVFYYPLKMYPFKRLRILGSASLEICMIADGSFDCFIDIRKKDGKGYLRVYDVAASLFIAKKAGAVITDLDGNLEDKKISMDERFRLVVSNEKIHEKVKSIL